MSAQQPKYDSQDRVKANLLTTAKTLDVHDLIAENKYRAPHFDLGYITPVDRIASYYTRGLTMKHANTLGGRVKDATIRSGRMSPRTGKGGRIKSTTAAMGQSVIQPAPPSEPKSSKASTRPGTGTNSRSAPPKPPNQSSYHSRRAIYRHQRSPPKNRSMKAIRLQEMGSQTNLDFNDWDPMVLDHNGHEGEGTSTTTADVVDIYTQILQRKILIGVATAEGSGKRTPLPTLESYTIDNIIMRLAMPEPAAGAHNPSRDHEILTKNIEEIRKSYSEAVGRGILEYELLDEVSRNDYGINLNLLRASPKSWTSGEYNGRSWRILRETGVPNKNVNNAYLRMSRGLFITEPLMLHLHLLWIDGAEEEDFADNEEDGGFPILPGESFGDILFTDVCAETFRKQLPMSLADFTRYVKTKAMSVRGLLKEHWLRIAAHRIQQFLLSSNLGGGTSNADDEPDEFLVTERSLGAHGSNRDQVTATGATATGDSVVSSKAFKTRASLPEAMRVINTAEMLLSRQLRSTCEKSLQTVVKFFERFRASDASGDSAFSLVLKFNEKFDGREASKLMTISPSIEEIIAQVSSSIDEMILQAEEFPRPIEELFEEEIDASEFLGPCTMELDDELVRAVHTVVNKEIKLHFAKPQQIIETFIPFKDLASGQVGSRVLAVMPADEPDPLATEEHLGNLTTMVTELNGYIKSIEAATPDISFFPMFKLNCVEAKKHLSEVALDLKNQLIEHVAGRNRERMENNDRAYQNITDRLLERPKNSEELAALKDYANSSHTDVRALNNEFLEQTVKRIEFLFANNYTHTMPEMMLTSKSWGWLTKMVVVQKQSKEIQNERDNELKKVVQDQQAQFVTEQEELSKEIASIARQSDCTAKKVDELCFRITEALVTLDEFDKRAENIAEQEENLCLPFSNNEGPLGEMRGQVEPLKKAWDAICTWVHAYDSFQVSPLAEVDAEGAERQATDLQSTLMKVSKQIEKKGSSSGSNDKPAASKAADKVVDVIKRFMKECIPLMHLICTQGIKDRHWKDIKASTGLDFESGPSTTLKQVYDIGLHLQVPTIEDTCVSAAKENGLEKAMDKMEGMWQSMEFGTKEWRGSRILTGIDDIQTELDDQIVKTQAMRGSRYITPYIERVTRWEKILTDLQDIIDNWLKVQSTWLYLEPIFSSDDIMRQLPTEGKLFTRVDSTWKESMVDTQQDPGVMAVAQREGLLDGLIEANKTLDQIQKGLSHYLETKRGAFPRFFFLSNDELLEILAETKDPTRVQPHLKKCFDGIAKLEFNSKLDILSAYDPGSDPEQLPFYYKECSHRLINPKDSSGNVELWLLEVEIIMKKSMAHLINICRADYGATSRLSWIQNWQGQAAICVNQIAWTAAVEDAIQDNTDGPGGGCQSLYESLQKMLLKTVELVRGKLPKKLRTSIGALVVMDVHNRETTKELAHLKVSAPTDFDWQAHLRYYHVNDNSAKSGMPESVQCRMINAMILYAYEYIGNNGRLVITPLTDRCYRTLMGAIHLNLGGAPEGPAGTGKTETTKDLGKAIAIQCVVTNCSDGLDYKAMGKFFKGLASAGAWACFDEFNRIILEVLSVVAQQILTIQQAKAAGLTRFVFEGVELGLKHTCCPFITMNPGYAGRAELPDNLKVLFRTVAMMVPDYAMIGEIILYSMGYMEAKPLAVKIVTTYQLCSEQLSSQSHYDYGMRAVISVLRAAGNLKQTEGHLSENVLVLRSIIDVNLPKFLSPDVPLFEGITSDLFPGVDIQPPDREAMSTAFLDCCTTAGLRGTDYFWAKVVQIYDMMIVRHGFMIVGQPFSGKSGAWKILSAVLELLHEKFPDDSRWTKVVPFLMNPKSITMGQLYGQFDPVSHEWSDGVLAIQYRNAAQNKVCSAEDRKWVLFDGPVDAIWIENMNTVLDDNKKLCLMSGEIIAMSDTMSMIFEPMDLLVASPATVSRCGMVYMEPEQLGWQCILHSWLENFSDDHYVPDGEEGRRLFYLTKADRDLIAVLFEWLAEPCMAFLRRELTEMAPSVDAQLMTGVMNLMEVLLADGLKEDFGYGKSADAKSMKMRRQHLECSFMFGLIWSACKTGIETSQARFSEYLRKIMSLGQDYIKMKHPGVMNALAVRKWIPPDLEKGVFSGRLNLPLPNDGSIYDYCYIPEEGKWKTWVDLLPKFKIADKTPYSSIVVPTAFTSQMSHLVRLMVPHKKPVLICGPTGTGKSVIAFQAIANQLPQNKYKPLCLGFSAKTSANMTQGIIDGKLDKRRKGVYGPPLGQQAIVFVDDLNMPEVEIYGAQPPIELIRQLIDSGGWYDLNEKTWQKNVDVTVLGAMGPPGSGRNHITPRLMRHFLLLCFAEFDDETLERIFTTTVRWYLDSNKFTGIVGESKSIVAATLSIYRGAMASLLPTPRKSHYTFNLRDFSRVIQGVLLITTPTDLKKPDLVRLWTHEVQRVFGDRLVDQSDREWFLSHVDETIEKTFNLKFNQLFEHLDTTDEKKVTTESMRRLFFGDYLTPTAEDARPYSEVQDFDELSATVNTYLEEYNTMSQKPMDLVMFAFAIEHVSRISRVLKMPGGNALLVGVGGSGRQSVTRLATFMAGYRLFQIEISKSYGIVEWREDLKSVLKGAGTGPEPMVFLFSDTQIKTESFVEDINNILNSGEVPNIFPNDERSAICEAVGKFAKEEFGKHIFENMDPVAMYAYFISRVRANLHVCLAFSPIGAAFRDRLRKFPSLINCCAIDWFTTWPEDALDAVAKKFLKEITLDSDETRKSLENMCATFHENTIALSTEYESKLKRVNYVTPTSYLELIKAFKDSLGVQRELISSQKKRYDNGLQQLAFATESVNKMSEELTALQPVLVQKQEETAALMVEIEAKLPGVEEQKAVVGADAAVAQAEADKVNAEKESVEADLAEAIPALNEAVKALDTIKQADINEVKNFKKPPETIKLICEAVCVMLSIKPQRIPDPDDPSKRIMDYWGPSQTMLADKEFIPSLKTYDKDNIDPKKVETIKTKYMTQENFTKEAAKKASTAALGLCAWCLAMITYDRVAKVVAPKKAALEVASQKLAETMAELAEKEAALKEVVDALQALQDKFDEATRAKEQLERDVELTAQKLDRAKQLIDGLGGERSRWTEKSENLGVLYMNLTGDVLISAGVMAYLGPFTVAFRQKQVEEWVQACKSQSIPCSDTPTLTDTLGDPVQIREWIIDGLPTDNFSKDNGIIVFNARRWPLMIDPQGQANKWVRTMEEPKGLSVIKLTDANFMRSLENSIQFGKPVLLENVGEDLDPSLEPLLLKQLFKQGTSLCIRLGDSTIEYSDSFRFYMTTKLRNPHYLPETSVKVTLLNFMITPEGLEDQLLGVVVAEERPDLEEQKNQLLIESAENAKEAVALEDTILKILSSEGNILEDESAIRALNESKDKSNIIKEAQEKAEETEKEIDKTRQGYRPIAYHSQVLFFCISDLANIEPVYQYSLGWFVNLFVSSIQNAERNSNVPARLKNLSEHFTFSLYRNICRSLLEKDKLLFSMLLTIRILASKGKVNEANLMFFLTGGVMLDNPHPKPAEWISQKTWNELCTMDGMSSFIGIREAVESDIGAWQAIYDSTEPHHCALPGKFTSAGGLIPLCILRAIRPDKVVLAVQDFVVNVMTEKFVKPPPFDLSACYEDSSAATPLVFILSPGADPMSAIVKAASIAKKEMKSISLGQGQGPLAEKMIKDACQKGTWVVLQNCHLMPSWMTDLERITENFNDRTNKNFRLWCTTYPSDVFPVSVLQNGVKMTIEPPKGLRANILGSLKGDPLSDLEFYTQCTKPKEFGRLVFCLCFFHAVIQERKLFGPLGWNIPYEFNNSDLEISTRQLILFLDENETTPFNALRYTAGECNYGGRVTDDKDRRCLASILARCYNPAVLTEDECALSTSGTYRVPPDGDYDAMLDFVDELPLTTGPEVFGMHDNASITRDTNDTNALLSTILLTQGSTGGGSGSSSSDDIIETVATDVLAKLPEPYDMEAAMIRYPVKFEQSMNTVLAQELLKFNRLTGVIRSSLTSVQKAVKGLIVMDAALESLGNALIFAQIPVLWKDQGKSYPSLKPLPGYIADLIKRLDFFGNWLHNTYPKVYWLSGFFFTQAFLTGAKQNFARKFTIPIDHLDFDQDMMPEDDYDSAPEDGVYTRGLFMEGARWDKRSSIVAESIPKILFSAAPVMWFRPVEREKMRVYPNYECPLYKTGDRRGVLATTGHSSNFVCYIRMPSDEPPDHWIQRGVAMLTQLND